MSRFHILGSLIIIKIIIFVSQIFDSLQNKFLKLRFLAKVVGNRVVNVERDQLRKIIELAILVELWISIAMGLYY